MTFWDVAGTLHGCPFPSATVGEFREGWIPDDFCGGVAVPRMTGA